MNQKHVDILNKGAKTWNAWRKENPEIIPDLSNYYFVYAKDEVPDLNGVNLSHANLKGAYIQGNDRDWPDEYAPFFENSNFEFADLSESYMFRTKFNNANLRNTNLTNANIQSTGFNGTDLSFANFSGAEIKWSGFANARLESTNFEGATLIDINFPDAKSWSPIIDEKTTASGIILDSKKESQISIDDLELSHAFSLMLDMINVATEKVVLILGRFYKERKEILDAIRNELRDKGFIALVFDFEKPARRDITETVSLLAHLSRFVVADITDAKSIPQELQAVVPNLPSVVFLPILQSDMVEYAMYEHFRRYEWVLPIFYYDNKEHLISSIENNIINPAITKSDELLKRRDINN